MNHHSATLLTLVAVLLAAPQSHGHDQAAHACAAIASALDRLDCFDAYAQSMHPPATSAETTLSAPPYDPAASTPADAAPKAPAANTAVTEQMIGQFGFEALESGAAADVMTSRFDGAFTGWSGQTLFRLENGQVWKQSQNGRASYNADRPVITIRRGAFGSYRLSVEGLSSTIRVERIK